jgi:hypothetical protein
LVEAVIPVQASVLVARDMEAMDAAVRYRRVVRIESGGRHHDAQGIRTLIRRCYLGFSPFYG